MNLFQSIFLFLTNLGQLSLDSSALLGLILKFLSEHVKLLIELLIGADGLLLLLLLILLLLLVGLLELLGQLVVFLIALLELDLELIGLFEIGADLALELLDLLLLLFLVGVLEIGLGVLSAQLGDLLFFLAKLLLGAS